jgi:hypothetical protein
MDAPKTVPELIDAYGGATVFAKAIGLKTPSTASEMKRSASIRVHYWPAIVATAPTYDIPGVTLESLARMHIAEPARAAS